VSHTSEDDRLRAESDQLERLLDEVQAMVAPPAWERVERIVHHLLSLYSEGLARTLAHARAAGADLDDRVSADDLLASLLLLHGLHPLAPDERIRRVLVRVVEHLGGDAPALELVGLDADGTAHIQATGKLGGGAMSAGVVEAVIHRAVQDAAPEVTRVAIAGTGRAPDPALIQIRRSREAR
jgi:Fe-S cluster biogenesis protein NfuA